MGDHKNLLIVGFKLCFLQDVLKQALDDLGSIVNLLSAFHWSAMELTLFLLNYVINMAYMR